MRLEGLPVNSLVGPSELRATGGTIATNPATPGLAPTTPGAAPDLSFGQVLGQELQRVNDSLGEADRQAQLVATGDAENLHEAMVAMAEADLALQVTLRVTQKAVAAYQEISRMQI